jgi:colanic acid/amylovoran biosynthesis glycosyltransferase
MAWGGRFPDPARAVRSVHGDPAQSVNGPSARRGIEIRLRRRRSEREAATRESDSMKVGYVLDQFPCYTDTAILNEMLELEAQGVELHIFSLRSPGEEPRHEELDELQAGCTQLAPLAPANIRHHLEAQRAAEHPDALEEAECLASRVDDRVAWRNDALAFTAVLGPQAESLGITHLHAHRCGLAAATAQETTRLTGIPFSFALHAEDFARPELTPEVLSERMREASFAVTDCKAHAARVAELCGQRAGSWIRVIYKGIDTVLWNTKTTGARLADFIAVGPMEARKGFDDYLAACSLLKERGHEFRALLVGAGPEESRLRLLAKRLGLNGCLEFTGPLTQEELRPLLARCAALVAPCVETEEGAVCGTPMAILEAMAAGVPPIATTVGGIPELIEDPTTGWLIAPRDTEALVRAMRRAMKHHEETARRGERARRRAESFFDLEANLSCLARMMYRSSRRKIANQTRAEDLSGRPF